MNGKQVGGWAVMMGLATGAMLVPVMASAAVAYGFEDAAVPGNSGGTLAPQATVGVTEGTYSLGINVAAGWHKTLELWNQNYAATVLANDKMLIDVSVPNVGSWASLEAGFYGDGNGGWQAMAPTTGGIYPGADKVTLEYVYDGSSLVQPAPGATWWNMLFILNSDLPAGTTIHVDNLRFESVPEPASLSLLSLGALAAMRRRR